MRTTLSVSAALAVITALALAGPAAAKTYEVTRTSDPNPGACKPRDCSLREAVIAANDRPGGDKIVLRITRRPYKLTIDNTDPQAGEELAQEGDLDVLNGPLAIVHPGAGRATVQETVDDRVFEVLAPASLSLKRLAVTGGDNRELDNDSGGAIQAGGDLTIGGSVLARNISGSLGGAIDMEDAGDLRIVGSTLKRNEAENTSGAIRSGDGAITITRSRLVGNVADSDGGAIRISQPERTRIVRTLISGNRAGEDGGGLQSTSATPLTIIKSTIANNRAGENGGGIYSADLQQIEIRDSTISGNRANGPSGNGGGVYLDGPTVTITNSTVDGNRANARGGGIHAQDGADLTLNAVTVTRNAAAADDEGLVLVGGGGLYRLSSAGFDVRNSLIGLNTIGAAQTSRNDCAGDTPFDSLGNNLLSSPVVGTNCEGFDEPTDLVRANPKIEPLRKNGGPTKTVALKAGSAAIGHAHMPSAPDRDQRGRQRDNNPDTGAFERGA